jgi:hypothetical protein
MRRVVAQRWTRIRLAVASSREARERNGKTNPPSQLLDGFNLLIQSLAHTNISLARTRGWILLSCVQSIQAGQREKKKKKKVTVIV